jgi:glycerol uptake facilitator-like aquaporin
MVHTTASPTVLSLIVAVKTAILVLGGLITYFSYKAYRNTQQGSLRALTIGFGIITFGALLAGVLDTILNVSLALGVLVDAALTLLGFAVITYSLYTE